MPAPRVISLLPSATEIVAALGAESLLVGRSHECDHPDSIRHLPVCSAARLNDDAPSGELDREVKALLAQGLPLYELKLDTIRQLRPDLILTQAQCQVCAVSQDQVAGAAAALLPAQPRVVSLSPKRFADLWTDMLQVAEALGRLDEGRVIIKEFKQRCVSVIEKVCLVKKRPTVACLEWLDPLMVAGNWVPEMVDLAGGVPLFGTPGRHSPGINWSVIQERDPEVLLVMPCGFDLDRTEEEFRVLTRLPRWQDLQAVRKGRVYLLDGNAYFNRPGPRLVDSLEMLAELFHPTLFTPQYEGKGWKRPDHKAV